ncbi:MAG: AI-2E family transporter, partial [Terriglobales bacterium]
RREFLDALMSDLHDVWGHFIRAQLILMLIAIAVYILFLTVIGMPYALPIGLSAGLFEFIPTLGPIIAAVMILGGSFVLGYGHWALLIGFLVIWRVEQDYVNSPKIMGSRLNIHPFLVIFAVLTGAEIAGILGVFLSVPIVASLRVFYLRWQAYDAARFLTPVTPTGPSPPETPPPL